MKTIITSLSILGLSFGAHTQITLTNSDFADGGDTVRVSSATDPTIDFISTGANHVWNFSNLTPDDQTLVEYNSVSSFSPLMQINFGFTAPAEYQATNFTMNDGGLPVDQINTLLPISISDVNLVSKNDADSITSVGHAFLIQGVELSMRSDTIETRYKFPANFGDSYSSRGYSNIDLNPTFDATLIQYRQRNTVIDGWGTITTPYGSFNALRYKHIIEEQDSIYLGLLGSWIEVPVPSQRIYEWWTNGELSPVLQITTSDLQGVETVTSIKYRDSFNSTSVGVSETLASEQDIRLYPNPVTDELSISGLNGESQFIVFDQSGNKLLKGVFSNGQGIGVINVDELTNGRYFIMLKDSISGIFQISSFVKK